MDVTGLVIVLSALGGGLAFVVYLIAADRNRFLVRFDLSQWREKYYIRALPNFLQALHDHHFKSPFPAQTNAVSASYFRFRSRPLLARRPTNLRRAFLNQHITLFGLLATLKPFLRDFILNEQQRIIGNRVVEMEDTIDRDTLMAYLQYVREERRRFFATLPHMDRATLGAIIDRRFIPTLRTIHAIYQEHGYSLMPELSQLRQWEQMSGSELVQELPPFKVPSYAPTKKRRATEQAA